MVEKDAETERKRCVIDAEKEAQVAEIRFRQKIMEKESQQRIAAIENEIELARRRTQADAEHYSAEQRAKGNSLVFTPEYLEFKRIEALAGNTKVYFGDKIPPIFAQIGSDGAVHARGFSGSAREAKTPSGGIDGSRDDEDGPKLPDDFLRDVLGKSVVDL